MKVERQVLDAAEELERLRAEVKALTKERNQFKKKHEAQKATSKELRRELREWSKEFNALWDRQQPRVEALAQARYPEVLWEADRQRRRAKVFLEAVCLLETEAAKREWEASDAFNALWRRQKAKAEAIDRERFPGCMCVPGRSDMFWRP